jgi:hypothetical protein
VTEAFGEESDGLKKQERMERFVLLAAIQHVPLSLFAQVICITSRFDRALV